VKLANIRKQPPTDTIHGDTFESQSHPKTGVARTEARDMTRKATAIFVIGKSRLDKRNGDKVASTVPILYAPAVAVARLMRTGGLVRSPKAEEEGDSVDEVVEAMLGILVTRRTRPPERRMAVPVRANGRQKPAAL